MTDRTKGTLQILAWITIFIVGWLCGFMIGWSTPSSTQDEIDKKPSEEKNIKEIPDITLIYEEEIKTEDLTVSDVKEETVFDVKEETVKSEPVFLGTFDCTAYCPCEKCCGIWGKNRPIDENGKVIVYTASGAIAKANHTIAVDPSVIPYGTKIIIDGVTYVAEDCGGGIKNNRIDIYFESHEDALQFGRQKKDVYLG